MPPRAARKAATIQLAEGLILPTPPRRPVGIYALPEPKVARPQLIGAAKALGLEARVSRGRFEEDELSLGYSEEPHGLRLFRASGGIRYADLSRWQRDDGGTNLKLNERSARAQASRLLRRLKLDDFAHARFERAAPLNVAVANVKTREATARVIDVALVFRRVIDGLPVDGPGGRAVVYFDARGVTGVDALWRRRGRAVRRTQLFPSEFAIEQIEQRLGGRGAERAQLHELRLAYFELGWDDRQRYLQPAYVAFVTLLGPDHVRTARVEVIPASPRPVAGLTPPAKPRLRPTPRRAARSTRAS